jgi:Uma2 family endonuclease
MATATKPRRPASDEGLRPYRLTVDQFERMIAAGVLTEDDHVELLGGLLAEQMTKHAPHNFSASRLRKLLERRLGDDWVVFQEGAVKFGQSWRPEPDLAVVLGPDDRYRRVLPSGKEVLLLVEVAESSYPTDRGVKWHGYAAAGVPVYWIVDLDRRVVEVHTSPTGRGKTAKYREIATFGPGDDIPVVVAGRAVGTIAVREILP